MHIQMNHGYSKISDNPNLGSINFSGVLKLTNCGADQLHVNGQLALQKSTLKGLEIRGKASFTDSQIDGDSKVEGPLKAVNTIFNGVIRSNASNLELTGGKARNIIIEKPHMNVTQTVLLKGGVVVEEIHFEGENGQVRLFPGTVFKGQIKGGALVQAEA